MTLTEWIRHEIQQAELKQSKHAEHFDHFENVERWAFFQGYLEAMRAVLEHAERRGL